MYNVNLRFIQVKFRFRNAYYNEITVGIVVLLQLNKVIKVLIFVIISVFFKKNNF